MKLILKYICVIFVLLTFISCNGSSSDDSTNSPTVEIQMVDKTGTIDPNQEYIMSIYDPSNNDDFRYSQYSTKRTVTFEDVEPGLYRAHVTGAQKLGENAFELTIEEGDDISIVFTYYEYASYPVNIGGIIIYQPLYKWRYNLTRY